MTVTDLVIAEQENFWARIKTEYDPKPIPDRQFDWCAYDPNTYDADCDQDGFFSKSPVGYGRTKEEALQDLAEKMEDANG